MRVVLAGAAGGIGGRVARRLVAADHDVVGLDRDDDGLAALPDAVETATVDLAAPAAVADALDDVAADAVVSCVGWYELGAVEDCSPAAFERHLDANLAAVHHVVAPLLPDLRRREGRVVAVGSVVGATPLPFHGAYAAAKAGLAGYVTALRREVAAHGVDVALVEPGPTPTGFNERAAAALDREGDPGADDSDAGPTADAGNSDAGPAADADDRPYDDAYRALSGYAPQSVSPEAVTETVVTATTTARPRARYRLGARARWLPRLGAVLPTRLFDRIVRSGLPDGLLGRLIDR